MKDQLSELITHAEKIGVIGSPSSTTELALDIMAQSVNKKLVGELAFFPYQQDNFTNYALGQITEVKLRNIWHEDPTIRSLIRQRGTIDAVSERQDTHQGEMTISAVFANSNGNYKPSILGTVPATGTPIYLANDELLDELLSPYKSQLFYLGNVYGSKPKLPLWFKHFDRGADGAGEAYHIGIFGKTGSGKSVLAKQILLAYSQYKKMGLLVIDPQGEFSNDIKGNYSEDFPLPVKEILQKQGKETKLFNVKNLVLDRWDLFSQILFESPFFEQLSTPKGENRTLAAEALCDQMKKKNLQLKNLHTKDSFDVAWKILGDEKVQKVFYRSPGPRDRFVSMYENAMVDDFYSSYWLKATQLFRDDRDGARKVESILFDLFNNRPLIVIDLSHKKAGENGSKAKEDENLFWNDTIQSLVIRRLLEGINLSAEIAYKSGKTLNTLILIDEAHRLAPREDPDNDYLKAVRNIFIDAVRTTRKYGVGWMFISQTLSSLHREIIGQLRIFFFGFGLAMGSEFRSLSELIGGRSKSLDLYQLFRDPHSSFDTSTREYSFMTIGPVSPLSFSGTPLFLNAFSTVEQFCEANNLLIKKDNL